jgi:DNA processing protein
LSELVTVAFAAATGGHVLSPPRNERFAAFRRAFDEDAFRCTLSERGVRWLARSDPGFPPRLRAIHDPPLGLFLRGAGGTELLARSAVALVGARSCSAYGAQVARSLGRELAAAGVVVVSGLARGVDGEAHRGALDAGGTTVAVLGCGVDRDYPASHRDLAERIAERALVVSEYAPGVEPAPWRFPARNRIVAGLALATVVVEAREASGALITADLALEEGRDVFAVPGEITSALSAGTNALLRLGAVPLTSADDVLSALGLEAAAPPAPAGLIGSAGGEAGALLERLRDGPATADELARATGRGAGELAVLLSELELAGLVTEADGVYRAALTAGRT